MLVAVELLDPLQVDDRHHADQQVGVAGDVDLGRHHRAVQAFVEQHVGAGGQVFPGREGARLLLVGRGLDRVVQVLAALAGAGLGVAAEQLLEFGNRLFSGPKWLKCLLPCLLGLGLALRISLRS
jgi:hypothetical protein